MVKDDPDFKQVVIGKDPIPVYEDVQIVVCGEVMEHLCNPGMFLDELKAGILPDEDYQCSQCFCKGTSGLD